MAAMTNIIVKDDTPVAFTFKPVTDNPIPNWRTSIALVPIEGQMRLWFESTLLKTGGYKLTIKLEVPVMETLGVSGTSGGYVAPPKVAYKNVGIFTLFVDKRSTSADRANLLKLLLGAIQGASATADTGLLDNTSAASAFVNSVLPGPIFFTALEQPN